MNIPYDITFLLPSWEGILYLQTHHNRVLSNPYKSAIHEHLLIPLNTTGVQLIFSHTHVKRDSI
jgi:hypothetical protein